MQYFDVSPVLVVLLEVAMIISSPEKKIFPSVRNCLKIRVVQMSILCRYIYHLHILEMYKRIFWFFYCTCGRNIDPNMLTGTHTHTNTHEDQQN